MKLLFASPSPFARKVRVLARELELNENITEIPVNTTPVSPAEEVTAANPLSKIPTLITDKGVAIFDSRVIAEYLLSIANKAAPEKGIERWLSLRRQALADGVLDAGLAHRYETLLRPKELHWAPWLEAQQSKMLRGLRALANDLPAIGDQAGLDAIAIACTLGWVEFRMPEIKWRESHPELATFFEVMSRRTSMMETHPAIQH
jgi:glutathione S-transferase